MNIIKRVLLVIALLSMNPAGAVTISLTGNRVGMDTVSMLSDGSKITYWAGIVEINMDGTRYLAMPTTPPSGNFSDYLGISWEAQLYSQGDILAGGTPTVGEFAASSEFAAASLTGVATASQYYSMVSGFFLNALLGYDPADPLWAASFNEMVWQTLLFVPLDGVEEEVFFSNANTVYDVASGVTLRDVYNTDVANGLDQNFDFSNFMTVAELGGEPYELLVFMNPVPVPSAYWLFISGVIGLMAVVRKPTTDCSAGSGGFNLGNNT